MFPLFSKAQEVKRIQEVGLTFSSFNIFESFGITYRVGTEKGLWRFNALFIDINSLEETQSIIGIKTSNINFGLRVGRESRTLLTNKLEFRVGGDLGFRYNYNSSTQQTINGLDESTIRTINIYPGINGVFGFNYIINKNLILGGELLPSWNLRIGTRENIVQGQVVQTTEYWGTSFGLSNNGILLSLAYRF